MNSCRLEMEMSQVTFSEEVGGLAASRFKDSPAAVAAFHNTRTDVMMLN